MSGERETSIRCPVCLQAVTYCKVCFYRDRDNAFDWRLNVWCGCGDVTDPVLLRAVRDFYGAEIGAEISAMQEGELVQRIGPLLDWWLDWTSRREAAAN